MSIFLILKYTAYWLYSPVLMRLLRGAYGINIINFLITLIITLRPREPLGGRILYVLIVYAGKIITRTHIEYLCLKLITLACGRVDDWRTTGGKKWSGSTCHRRADSLQQLLQPAHCLQNVFHARVVFNQMWPSRPAQMLTKEWKEALPPYIMRSHLPPETQLYPRAAARILIVQRNGRLLDSI